ncbi:MAG: ABC transporter substrate-binding protein [Desulfitobacteriia bacterium]|jgi:branched-chain amino acid transport system substrate-binding protein
MRKTKIITYAFVALVCLALVTGCSPSAPAPREAETIKIGGIFEITGDMAEFGIKGENGVKLAIREINNSGGVLGKQIEYVGADNRSDAEESKVAATKLIIQDKVVGIVGPMTNLNTLAVIPVVSENKIPLITPTGTNTILTVNERGELNEWIFRACFIDSFQGEVAANFALDTIKAKTAALIIDQKGDYAKSLAASFKEIFEAGGGKVVATEQYIAGQDKNFYNILTRIRAENPDVIFVPGHYNDSGFIVRQARDLKIQAAVLGGDLWGTGPIADVAGAEAMNNTYYVDHVAVNDPELADFAAAYKAEYGQDIDSFATLGYDAAKLLLAAIERAGNTDAEAIKRALESTSGFNGVSGEINVDPATHNPKKSASIQKFVDGLKVFATRVDP